MAPNYIFRDANFARRYFKGLMIYQAFGLGIFIVLASLLSFLGLGLTATITIASGTVVALALFSAYVIHKRDFRLLKLGMWPVDTKQQAIQQIRKMIAGLETLSQQTSHRRKETEDLLAHCVSMQKRVNKYHSPEANLLRKEISQGYLKIVDVRAEFLALQKEIARLLIERKSDLEIVDKDENEIAALLYLNKKEMQITEKSANLISETLGMIKSQLNDYYRQLLSTKK